MEIDMIHEREYYIDKLDRQIHEIENILKMDSGTVINAEFKKKIKSLKRESEIVLKKLKNNQYEVAIVGLEKAGKSTFANALMENNLLPTKDLRCTFTSTQIEYSGDNKEDSAIVSFYSTKEFDRDFKDKLCKLDFPNYERYSFDTIDEKTYLSIYNAKVADDKKRAYSDSIHEDILAIIRNVASLSELLDRPLISFSADRIDSGELAEYITNEAKARAVKQVIIRSKKLCEMKNAIIFDVPGFNSPTELHKIQTLERMKSADAIIMVTNGISPSLTGESLKILRESDDEGNPLNDKLFVFANKIEGASDIAQNINDTYDAWINKGFVLAANKHRIIFGSALAHLQALGLDKDNRTLRNFNERKDQMPFGDGIEHMRQVLAEYNQTERFGILKRRVNRIKADIAKAFSDICIGYDVTINKTYSIEQVRLNAELIDDIRPLAEKKLLNLRAAVRSDIASEQPLSKRIVNYITNNITTDKYSISDEMIDTAIKSSPYTGNYEDTGRIEADIRKAKFKEMYEDFSQNVINIADKYHMEYSAKIIDILLEAMGSNMDSPYYNDLKELLKNEISVYRSDLLSSEYNSKFYYQSLIERFSRDIYQVLITSQYNEERLREFYNSIDNFYSLSIFYKKEDCTDDLSYIDIAPKDQPLCMMLLFHHYFNIEYSLRILSEDICKIVEIKAFPDEVWKFAEKAFFATCGQKDSIIDAVKRKVSDIEDFIGKTDDFKISILKNILAQLININKPCSAADKEAFTKYYRNYHSSLKGGKLYSVEDFKEDFNIDIQILQDVLTNAFVRAINMEKPFIARETKSIDDIIDYIKSKSFGKFLTKNFDKIKYKENQILDKQRREQEKNAAIIEEIQDILANL